LVALASLVAGVAATTSPVRADELEPETGTFAGFGPPEPYELLVRRAMFEEDTYRQCQFVVLPSFAAENAVYILEPKDAEPVVISRTLKRDLWASMMEELSKSCANGSFQLDVAAESFALSKLQTVTETHRAKLSRPIAETLNGVCRDVLLRVRYPKSQRFGADGTTYHMGHWIQGAFLAGTTWSPRSDTLPGAFVELGERLKAYAHAAPDERKQAEVRLIAQASQVRSRISSK
jgi:hypothetical protein